MDSSALVSSRVPMAQNSTDFLKRSACQPLFSCGHELAQTVALAHCPGVVASFHEVDRVTLVNRDASDDSGLVFCAEWPAYVDGNLPLMIHCLRQRVTLVTVGDKDRVTMGLFLRYRV